MGKIAPGLVHGANDEIEGDLPAAGEEIGKAESVDGAHGGDGIAFDAGDLDKAADGVTGETEMVFHRDFGGVLDLIQTHFKKLAQRGGGHGAGCADLSLTAAFGTGYGGVCFDEIADEPAGRKRTYHLFIPQSALFLHIEQSGGDDAAGAAGRGRDDQSGIGVLLTHGKGIGTNKTVFPGSLTLVDVSLVKKILRFPFHAQSAGERTARGQTGIDSAFHSLPYLGEIVPDIRTFMCLNVVGQTLVMSFAPVGDLPIALFGINLRCLGIRTAGDGYSAAAGAEDPERGSLFSVLDGGEVHGVGVGESLIDRVVENDLTGDGVKGLAHGTIGLVTAAGHSQRTAQNNAAAVDPTVFHVKQFRSPCGTHGVRTGWSAADAVNLQNGFHGHFLRLTQ